MRSSIRSSSGNLRPTTRCSRNAKEGFTNEQRVLDVAQARQDGLVPVLLLINDQGYGDHLYGALLPVIEETRVDNVSTHEIASADDPANFVRDGHFTRENDLRIGRALGEVIRGALERQKR